MSDSRRRSGGRANSLIGRIRFENLTAIVELFKSRAEFCRQLEQSPALIAQYFSEKDETPAVRGVGAAKCRDLEKRLDIPEYSMDREGGVREYLAEIARKYALVGSRVPQHVISARAAQELLPSRGVAPGSGMLATLTHLQAAAVEALINAMKRGQVSDAHCVELLATWMPKDNG